MAVKMMKWSPWPAAGARKFLVKVNKMRLEGFSTAGDDDDGRGGGDGREKVMAIEMRWKGGSKPGLVPFQRPSSKLRRHVSGEAAVKRGQSIVEWSDEFENLCSFSIVSKENALGPWEASFRLLYGAKAKLAVIGKASLNLAEMASKMEAGIEAKLPLGFHVAGEATLLVSLSFVEVRNSQESAGIVQNSSESKNMESTTGDMSADDSDESTLFDSEGMTESVVVGARHRVDGNSAAESESGTSAETQLDPVKKAGFFSWKRRRLSFKPGKVKAEPLIKKTSDGDEKTKPDVDPRRSASSSIDCSLRENLGPKVDGSEPGEQEPSSTTGDWEEKELVSRDGQARLKANVFFASFDQCSDKAAGESACTALVALIAHWLLSNPEETPTRSEFDRLIVKGSSEWRKLCDNQALITRFPNKHFDLETIVQAGLHPVSVSHDKSFIGFFRPDKFESLKEMASFDQIWEEISRDAEGDHKPRIYIVSWNDHFFVLKVEANAYYIIDTLGERLFEGCNQAYILRFDDSALMHGKAEHERVSGEEPAKPEEEKIEEEEICRGKECCREFIKRFLAAIPLRELESQEKKEPVSYFALHQRLQIEFNFASSFPQQSSSSSSPSNSSLFSSESVDY